VNRLNSSEVTANIRELIVQLMRGNATQAEALVEGVSGFLKQTQKSKEDRGGASIHRAQQTMYAIDEVRMMLAQGDYPSAVAAARDAGKEWNARKVVPTGKGT
jgi:hypothetical protein